VPVSSTHSKWNLDSLVLVTDIDFEAGIGAGLDEFPAKRSRLKNCLAIVDDRLVLVAPVDPKYRLGVI
jgi:hypothetical protein